MADLRITELTSLAGGDLAATDPLPIADLSASQTKKITAKAFVQQAVSLIDNASIPSAKVDFSGISGTQLSAGTVAASKFDTATVPATGGITVSGSNLQLVAPTSPIVRNAGTGSLEHATSGVTAGTYTKVTVDTRGHVTVGAAIAAADLPIAVSGTVGVMSPGTGLSVTGGGVLNHTSSITAGTTTGFTYDAQGHITGAVALAGADLPIATSSVRGAVRPGTGLSVDGNGILAVTAATNAALGGVIAGSDFSVSTGTISLAAQAGIAAGQYTKITINSKGIATAGTVLSAGDIPNLAASQITSGSLDIARIGANTITGAKVANYAVTKIGDTQPTADYIGQFFFNPLSRDLSLFDGNVFQPIGISVGEIVFAGTFDASAGGGTGHVASVTAEGTGIGLVEGSPLPAAATANNRYYLVVSEGGTITSGNAPQVALAPPDIVLSTGIEWTEVDVSQTFTSVNASQVAFTPEGTIAANNVQAAIEEVNNEKLGLAGGTVTGNLEIGTAGSLSFEGSTANAFETTIAVVDPTADRTITLPNETGTVIVSGNASIVNADINASAGIAYSKLATLTSGNILVGNGSNVATSVAMSGDVTITNAGVAAIASNVIVDGDISASAEIAVSKLADGTARQLLQTDAAGTGVEWTDNVDVPGTLDVTGAATFDGSVYVGGALTLEGTTADAFELTFACEPTADRTVTLPDATTTLAGLGVVQSFTVAQRGAITALTDGATITADFAAANNFSVTLGGNRTLANPSNQTAGQSGCIWITQDGTGSRTLAYGSQWDFTGGTAPTLSTAAASVDCLVYAVQSSTKITATLISNLS
jgi:YD repeat-containing protein